MIRGLQGRNITQVTKLGSILDLFDSINIFALLNIISEDADEVEDKNIKDMNDKTEELK